MATLRATICVDVQKAEERLMVEAWFAKWRERLVFCSGDEGCGCCVNIWNVEGPSEAMDELPEAVRASSEWAGI